jgi:Skp family chaperone for outer membrane proteins
MSNECYNEWQVEQFEQAAHEAAMVNAGKEFERLRGEKDELEATLEERIAELEAENERLKAENAALKAEPKPLEYWSDEKKQTYADNEGRSAKRSEE